MKLHFDSLNTLMETINGEINAHSTKINFNLGSTYFLSFSNF